MTSFQIAIFLAAFITGSIAKDSSKSFIVKYMRQEKLVLLNDQSPVLNCDDFDAEVEKAKKNSNHHQIVSEAEDDDDYVNYDDLIEANPVSTRFRGPEKSEISNLFDPMDANYALGIAEANPNVILDLNDCQFNYVLNWDQVMKNLKGSTILAMMKSVNISARIEKTVPHPTVAKLVSNLIRSDILEDFLNKPFPIKSYILRLLKNRKFVRYFDEKFFETVMNHPASFKILDSQITQTVMSAFPRLPLLLNQEALDYGSLYMMNQQFLNRLPCAVFLNAASNSTFVDKISISVLKAMSKNSHFWACLPVELVRHMMRTTKIATKLEIEDFMEATETMSKAKLMDPEVVKGVFDIQLPQVVSKAESDYFDWFNSYANHDWKKKIMPWLRR